MSWLKRIWLLPKAVKQFGARTIWLYAKYQLKLRSGWLRLQTPPRRRVKIDVQPIVLIHPAPCAQFKELLGESDAQVLAEADAILGGDVHLFGARSFKLNLSLPGKLKHWSAYQSQMPNGGDIKPVWEMGRFGWATVLARAYWLSGNEQYSEAFWQRFEEFSESNPPNLGPHWSSAQEVALRIISWAFCYSLLADSPSSRPERKLALARSIAEHAGRIPATIDYARAQNNNHLLSEGAGLYTAGAMLPAHPQAAAWRELGMAAFREGITAQVHEDGAYAQHSANYHRLMLQVGAWMAVMAGNELPAETADQLGRAIAWLAKLIDQQTGSAPNLGPNDGAYILPLSRLPFRDYRPALQAASIAFAGQARFPAGPWDEMALWLGLRPPEAKPLRPPAPIRITGEDSWAYFRVAHFKERPGHADQLHVDLWWRGINLARDAGSFLYTAPAPWNNALAATKVHNTLSINNQDQMTRAGRFLWLDWAQARLLSVDAGPHGEPTRATAEHDGYARSGLIHRRDVSTEANRWVITDHVLPTREKRRMERARLHWLLPDWKWQLENEELRLESPHGRVELSVATSVGEQMKFSIIRGGELFEGEVTADPVLGWYSPAYGEKEPALSLLVDVSGKPPFTIITTWTLPA